MAGEVGLMSADRARDDGHWVTRTFDVMFTTPAFLGDAHQAGAWRTPPFKHLLREWWRVAWAADHGFDADVERMRREEGLLFGNAWLSHREGGREVADHRRSLVRLRLDRWDEGKLKNWNGLEAGTVFHPEVHRTNKFRVGPHAYLGYGPLDGRGGTKLKTNAAIQAGESAGLTLAYPTTHRREELRQVAEANAPRIGHALWLMDRYGTLGGRSRNGWGSLALNPADDTPALVGDAPLRDWRDCLDRDWPHAVGRDNRGALIWQTEPHDDWKSLVKTLATLRIGLRTQLMFCSGDKAAHPEPRHWLSYPVTRHSVKDWGNARLPDQLRFKVREAGEAKLVGVIFHVPHLPPTAFHPARDEIECVWRCVHRFLDALLGVPSPSWPGCSCLDPVVEAERRQRLDEWWEHVHRDDKAKLKLTRIPE